MWCVHVAGVYQTAGGASFQQNCVCNGMLIDHYDRVTGDSTVTYTCRDKVPDGDLTTFSGEQHSEITNSYYL